MQNVTDEERTQKVGEMKMKMDPRELCKEHPVEFAMILEYCLAPSIRYVKTLHYTSTPDYDFIVKLFQRAAESQGVALDDQFDWNKENSQRKISHSSEKIQDAQIKRSGTLQQQNSLQIP